MGPRDYLRRDLTAIRDRRDALAAEATQVTLDLAAVANLPKTSRKIASVPSGISAPPAGGIHPKHLAEWVEGSGVDPDLARLCIESVSGDTVLRFLNPSADHGQLQKARKRLGDVLEGGWLCRTLDLDRSTDHFERTATATTWGCFKPNTPRAGWKKDKDGRYFPKVDKDGKPVAMKYEHPKGPPTQPFFLPFPRHIGERIARSNRCLAAYRAWEDEAERTTVDRWHWFLKQGATVWITEGAKKTAALLTAGKLAIGLSGIWNGCQKRDNGRSYLKPQLRRALQLGVRRVFTAFDWAEPGSQGEKDVAGAVDRLCRVIGYELKKPAIDCYVIDLPGPLKGVDDVLVDGGIGAIDALKLHCLPLRRWQAKRRQKLIQQRIQQPIALDSGRPVRTIDSRYISADDIPEDARLVAMLAPMETGKTAAVVAYIQRTKAPIFIPLHRRGLAGNVASRFQRPYQSEGKLVRPWLMGPERELSVPPRNLDCAGLIRFGTEVEAMADADAHGKIVVLDSSHADGSSHLDPETCRGAVLFLDEADASIWHLLTGSTEIQRNRTDVLENLVACLRAAKQVIIASAHLHEQIVAYLEKLLQTQASVLVNTHRPAAGRTVHWFGEDRDWLSALSDHITAGRSAYIAVTSQKSTSVYAASNLATYIAETLKVPADQILVVDSSTTRTTGHEARGVITNPARLLRYRVVIATPCIETGVSIEDPKQHFDAVFAYATGCTSPQATVQAIGRVRSDAPRYVCASRNGRTLFGGGIDSDDVLRLNRRAAALVRDSLFRAGIAEADEPLSTDHVTAWAGLVADYNLLTAQFAFSVRTLLATEGYAVRDSLAADPDVAATQKDLLREAGAANTAQQCQSVASSIPADQDALEELERRPELTLRQQQELEHGQVCRDFGIEQADDRLVLAHRQRALTIFRCELLLEEMKANGGRSDSLHALDSLIAMKRRNILQRSFIGDFNRAWTLPRIQLLHELGVLDLVHRRDEFTMADPELLAIHNLAKQHRDRCRTALGIDPCTVRTSTFLRDLAERLGYKLQKLSQKRTVDGKQHRLYVVADAFPGVERRPIKAYIRDSLAARLQQAFDDIEIDDRVPDSYRAVSDFQSCNTANSFTFAEIPVIASKKDKPL